MATFGGITFLERGTGNGTFLPTYGQKARVVILPIPGGDRVYVQILGYEETPIDIPARVTAAQLASLRSAVGTQASLANFVGGTKNAILREVADVQEVTKGSDTYFCTLKVVIVF
jgi:hypothetical protein